jgi:hypothetical protein
VCYLVSVFVKLIIFTGWFKCSVSLRIVANTKQNTNSSSHLFHNLSSGIIDSILERKTKDTPYQKGDSFEKRLYSQYLKRHGAYTILGIESVYLYDVNIHRS